MKIMKVKKDNISYQQVDLNMKKLNKTTQNVNNHDCGFCYFVKFPAAEEMPQSIFAQLMRQLAFWDSTGAVIKGLTSFGLQLVGINFANLHVKSFFRQFLREVFWALKQTIFLTVFGYSVQFIFNMWLSWF